MPDDPRILPYGDTRPRLGDGVFVADTARIIGDVVLGDGCSVWFGTVVRGDVHHIRVGDRVNLQDMTMVHVTTGKHPTIIGDDVTVGHRATLHGCTVEAGALVGMGAVVMDEAVVGEQAMVAAGALVTPGTRIPPRTLWVGSPARYKRDLNAPELEHLAGSAGHYCNIAAGYLASGLGGFR